MKTISSCLFMGVALLAASCTNSQFKKTKSGLLYKIYSDGKGPVAKKGEFLKANVIEKIRDSVLYTSYGSVPAYIPVDSPRPTYNPTEIFSLLRKGDSAVVVIMADTLLRRSNGQLPPFIKKKDKIIISFKVTDLFASQDLVMADRQKELDKQKDKEIKQVQDYLAAHNIQAQKTDLGTFYVVKDPGNGPQVDSGKQVSIRYTGKNMADDKVFESNMNGPGNEPFKVVIGAHQVIPGWDDALRKFKKGGKGTLYIPAYLAYNEQAMPGHKPFENLAFDIEVVDVTDAPAPSATPGMPGLPPGAGGAQAHPQGAQAHPQGAQPVQPRKH
ncbi:MAG TPA: FKBP-type peptidyl-prolyl cis-trans isomerase [Puia sp.]|nr:FKBP-type peptidyl-prolyl cis-trans isomerase [Puia sp.]